MTLEILPLKVPLGGLLLPSLESLLSCDWHWGSATENAWKSGWGVPSSCQLGTSMCVKGVGWGVLLGAKVGGGCSLRTFWASQKAALGQRPAAGWALRLVTQSWEGPGRVKLM